MFGLKIDDLAKLIALASAALYAAGFIVVNANLASYGDFDPDFSSPRYVFAGFLFVWYLAFVTWLVFKHMHDLRHLNETMDELKSRNRFMFYLFAVQLSGIEPLVRICLAASFFVSTTIDSARGSAVNNSPIILFYGLSLLINKFWNPKNLWLYQAVNITIQVSAIIVFSIYADSIIKEVAINYFLALVIFIFLYEPLLQKQKTFESKSTVAYFVLTSVGLIIGFGTTIYGHVKHQYGGGLPVSVTVYMKNDIGLSRLSKSMDGGVLLDMIALNDKKLIGISGGKLAIISADNIVSVVYP